MLDRPTLDHSKRERPALETTLEATEDVAQNAAPAAPEAEADPWRQLFGRHSNHLDGNQIRRMRTSLRQRLFADDVTDPR